MLESYWLQICPYYDSRVVIYYRKMFIRLATGNNWKNDSQVGLLHTIHRYTKSSCWAHLSSYLFPSIYLISIRISDMLQFKKNAAYSPYFIMATVKTEIFLRPKYKGKVRILHSNCKEKIIIRICSNLPAK